MRLLAHSPTGDQAVIAHDDGGVYHYRFADSTSSYTLVEGVTDTQIKDGWVIDNADGAKDTIDEITAYIDSKIGADA